MEGKSLRYPEDKSKYQHGYGRFSGIRKRNISGSGDGDRYGKPMDEDNQEKGKEDGESLPFPMGSCTYRRIHNEENNNGNSA